MSKSKKILTRIIFGAIMIAILTGLLYLDHWLEESIEQSASYNVKTLSQALLFGLPMVIVLLSVLICGALELSKLAAAGGVRLLKISSICGICLIAGSNYLSNLSLYFSQDRNILTLILHPNVLLSLILLAVFIEQMARHRIENAFRNISATALSILYLGVCGALIFTMRSKGVEYLVLFLAAVKSTDIGAYFTGSAIGKHKMIPWLSPGKSWEGLIGGLATAAGVSVFVAWAFGGIRGLETWELILFGVVMGIAGQFADLCESLLKRSADVKDSGSKVPEFGGVLDIIDSPLLAAPVAIVMFAILSL